RDCCSGLTCAAAEVTRQIGRLNESADDAYQYMWCIDTTIATPLWYRSWQVEVRLGVTVIQRQLLHSSTGESWTVVTGCPSVSKELASAKSVKLIYAGCDGRKERKGMTVKVIGECYFIAQFHRL
ncbi:hypothetical protein HAX54_036378, partial [Datura stramonium]|nr:hypothetical protein [Datura stramonium]